MVLDAKKQRLQKPLLHIQLLEKNEPIALADVLYQTQLITPSDANAPYPPSLLPEYYHLSTRLDAFFSDTFRAFLTADPNRLTLRGSAELPSKWIRVEFIKASLYLTVPKDVYEQLGLAGEKLKNDEFYHVICIPLLSKRTKLIARAQWCFQNTLSDTFDFIFCADSKANLKESAHFPTLEARAISATPLPTTQPAPDFAAWTAADAGRAAAPKRSREGKARTHTDPALRTAALDLLEWVGRVLHRVPAASASAYLASRPALVDDAAGAQCAGARLDGWVSRRGVAALAAHLAGAAPWSVCVATARPGHVQQPCDVVMVQMGDRRLVFRVPVRDPWLFSIR